MTGDPTGGPLTGPLAESLTESLAGPVAGPQHIATFCGQCDCGCPELWFDPDAEPGKRVVLTDDHGQRIQMNLQQLDDLHAELAGSVAALKARA